MWRGHSFAFSFVTLNIPRCFLHLSVVLNTYIFQNQLILTQPKYQNEFYSKKTLKPIYHQIVIITHRSYQSREPFAPMAPNVSRDPLYDVESSLQTHPFHILYRMPPKIGCPVHINLRCDGKSLVKGCPGVVHSIVCYNCSTKSRSTIAY